MSLRRLGVEGTMREGALIREDTLCEEFSQ